VVQERTLAADHPRDVVDLGEVGGDAAGRDGGVPRLFLGGDAFERRALAQGRAGLEPARDVFLAELGDEASLRVVEVGGRRSAAAVVGGGAVADALVAAEELALEGRQREVEAVVDDQHDVIARGGGRLGALEGHDDGVALGRRPDRVVVVIVIVAARRGEGREKEQDQPSETKPHRPRPRVNQK
jgi:hypothetical protein